MDSADVGSLWSLYYFWCAVCDPLVGIGIDILQARGIAATTLLVVFTPLWTYLMGHIWSPDSHNPTATTAVLLAFGLLQAMQLMLVSAVLGSVFPAGPCRQVSDHHGSLGVPRGRCSALLLSCTPFSFQTVEQHLVLRTCTMLSWLDCCRWRLSRGRYWGYSGCSSAWWAPRTCPQIGMRAASCQGHLSTLWDLSSWREGETPFVCAPI